MSEKTLTLAQKVATHVEISAIVADKALTAERLINDQRTKVANAIPAVVQSLIDNKVITLAEKTAAERVLADPVATLQLLSRVANGSQQKSAAVKPLGNPTGNGRPASREDMSKSARDEKFRLAIMS